VYKAFIAEYPSLREFAQANPRKQKWLLRPLGLHWRTMGMLKALRTLWMEYGKVPADYSKLLAVEGVGPYVAGATVCFSRNLALTLVDVNTVRVIGRVMGLKFKGEARRRKRMWEAIGDLCDQSRPREYYYAIIDLAHKICRPKEPNCIACPLLSLPCHFGQELMKRHQSGEKSTTLQGIRP
jgi:A/G-specific adenine glycosylase